MMMIRLRLCYCHSPLGSSYLKQAKRLKNKPLVQLEFLEYLMTFRAWAFIYSVFFTGLLIMLTAVLNFGKTEPAWVAFFVLAGLATIAQLYEAEGTFRNTYYPHSVFFLAAAILLDPLLFILVVAIPHLAEWIIKRLKKHGNLRAWYIQPFNVATHVLAGYAAWLVYYISDHQTNLFQTPAHVI